MLNKLSLKNIGNTFYRRYKNFQEKNSHKTIKIITAKEKFSQQKKNSHNNKKSLKQNKKNINTAKKILRKKFCVNFTNSLAHF